MNGKKCPNCGACQECGHVPSPPTPWFGPYYVPTPIPTWQPPTFYPTIHGGTSGGNATITFGGSFGAIQ